jgi:thiol-disulfide isomerase/thioredoxin
MLYLRDGDFLAGGLVDCDEPKVICWQMQGAARPFNFHAAALRAVYFPAPAAAPANDGDYMIELTDGDLLFGSLLGVSPERFEFDTPGLGRLHVARSEIRRITPASDATTVEYRGPNGLADWQEPDELHEQQWRDEAGRLITNADHAKLQKKLLLPKRVRVEVEIAWGGKPDFEFTLSSGTSDAELQEGFRFEVWQNSLVVLRALGGHADVAIVGELDQQDKRLQLEALIDQEQGSMLVYALNGRQLAEIKVSPEYAEHANPLEWISLVNGRGELRLERLAVGRWGGQLPAQVDAVTPGLLQTDGTIRYGNVIGFDADARQFTLAGGDGVEEQRIEADQIACIFPSPAAKSRECAYRVGLHNGSRVSGELTRVRGGKILLARPGIAEPLGCAIADVRSLVATSKNAETPVVTGRMGRLELESVRLHGSLVAATATSGDSEGCLAWQPRWSATGSSLQRDVSGRIVYRDPPPKPINDPARNRQAQRLQQRRPQPVGFWGQLARAFTSGPENAVSRPKPTGAGTLHLLAGDRIPCESVEIDETGVHFKSPVVAATFVPHDAVKALELVPRWTARTLEEEKRQRLLTLPRMQKPNPPTHLVASTGGDFLRTRLISLTVDTLLVESRLESKRIPRDRVACLIWLHDSNAADPPGPSDSLAEVVKSKTGPRIQAVRADGVQLTFVPQDYSGSELMGTSESLGECRVEVGAIDLLLLGAMIDRAADKQAFHAWKLSDAAEPRYLRDGAGEDGTTAPAALASGLIGKPAPEVRLDLLDGGRFRLADHRGHVVVLDFWASWCGPCMQAMPEVDALVAEFADHGVKLVAVNLQEDRAAVASALERLKVHPAVALDVDGALAEHYQVTAIPQTVVIDAEGNVAQLFVGAAPSLRDELRATLESLLQKSTPR